MVRGQCVDVLLARSRRGETGDTGEDLAIIEAALTVIADFEEVGCPGRGRRWSRSGASP
jgi:hypothetical protein